MSEFIDLDMMNVELRLPWPPSVNNYYGHSSHGVHLKRVGRNYREAVSGDVARQLGGKRIEERPLILRVGLFPPDKRKRDLDNHMKALLDALQASGLIEDDAWIDELHVWRGVVKPQGFAIIEISAGWAGMEDSFEDRGIELDEVKLVFRTD